MNTRRPFPGLARSSVCLSDLTRSVYEAEQLEPRRLLTASLATDFSPNTPLPVVTQLAMSLHPIPLPRRSPGAALQMAVQAGTLDLSSFSSPGSLAQAAASPAATVDTLTGNLSGKVLFTSGGHGYVWRPAVTNSDNSVTPGYWGFMRTYGYNFIEDTGNQDQITPYADYGIRSGATVVAMRPIGHQVDEVVMDNAMGYSPTTGGFQTISGTWTGNTATQPYWSVNNGNDTNHWVFAAASSTETAVARYTPNIPSAGFYPIYEWSNPGTNGSTNDLVGDRTYRINYTGGSAEVKVAANKVGNGWVYLGTYYFAQGVSGANVELSNKTSGATAGKYVVADGLRFGNGMGDWTGAGTAAGTHPVSGYPREDECALYWCYDSRGWTAANTRVSTSVVDANFGLADENFNFFACDRYAAYMNNAAIGNRDDRLWISFHSNASGSNGTGGAGRGTYGLITGSPTTNQQWLAETAGYTVQQDMIAAGFDWFSKDDGDPSTPYDNVYGPGGGYSEISNTSSYINGEFDATILEVAYHDNATDNALLKNPAVRDAVARATYHTALNYFHTFDSLADFTALPEPPADVIATTDAAGNVTISWTPGPSSAGLAGPYGNAPTSYRVHSSANGYGFDGGAVTTATSLTFSGLSTTSPTYFTVTALNAGGESEQSYVVVAKPQTGRRAPILIVNNFDRMDGTSDQVETKYVQSTPYLLNRARPRYNNSHDYVVQAASSVAAYNPSLGIESATDEAIALGQVNLSNYQTVIWMSGEESTGDTGTFRGAAATAVTNYLAAGGKLLVSGSEIGWDLVAKNNGKSFFANTLHATYAPDTVGGSTYNNSDDAGTHNFNAGVAGSALASVPPDSFDDGTHGTYDVDYPDVLGAGAGASVAMYYAGGTKAAAIQYASGNSRLLYLGFPLESVYNPSTRNAIVAGALNFFSAAVSLPPTAAPDLAATSDTGSSSTDNLTRLNTSLQFTLPGTITGATVKLYEGTTLLGQGTGNGGSLVITATASLSDGSHVITAKQTEPGLTESAATSSLTITVDTIAPTITLSPITTPRTTSVSSEGISFSEPVTGLLASKFSLTRDTSPNLLTASQSLTGSGSSYTLSNLASLTTNAGTYTLNLNPAGVTDAAGNAPALSASVTWRNTAVTGTAGADSIYIIRNPANPAAVDITVNGNTYTTSLLNLGQLSILGLGNNDSLTLDLSNGTPSFDPAAGITFTADPSSSLNLIGTPNDDSFSLSDTSATLNGLSLSLTNSPANLSITGGQGNDSLSLTNRPITFNADASLSTDNLSLNLGSNSSATFTATQHLASLTLTDNAAATLTTGGNKVLVTNSLSLDTPSRLDLADNGMIVANTPADTIRQYLLAGALFSSAAIANSQHTTALGYALSSDLGLTTFANQPLATPALLIKYTYLGDTDLNGRVDADDLARIDRGRAKSLHTWLAGDSNYDATIDATDLSLAYTAFHNQGPAL